MLSTRPKATNGGENTTYLPLKTRSALSELLLWPIRRGKEMNFNERVSEEILHIKERKFRVFCHEFCYAVLRSR